MIVLCVKRIRGLSTTITWPCLMASMLTQSEDTPGENSRLLSQAATSFLRERLPRSLFPTMLVAWSAFPLVRQSRSDLLALPVSGLEHRLVRQSKEKK